ncbi:hypothetical protein [Flammeovirga sp. EKP202]|uniref:hypothetical protein n=1 Tax=Flammeovirga sp. EKP202 TaxID=2770592 RepID=UPI00165FAEFA|nr:hypothetical protein [Flammeovirga sp. EKP202]MBD0404790.1 hypothetical protein [Flammeovirga sp. EKP202]
MERHITVVVLASIFMLITLLYGKYGQENYVMKVNNPEYLEEALTMADSLSDNKEINLHQAELIICGEAVKSLFDDADTMKLLEDINSDQVQLTLCKGSIEKHKINLEDFSFPVNVIHDSKKRYEKLQHVGYQEIEFL